MGRGPAAANRIVAGDWHGATPPGPQLSVDQGWFELFRLKLGDTMTLRFGAAEITAVVTSVREVDWDSFRVNFFMVLDPAHAGELPHSLIASFHVPPGTDGLAALSRELPNISLVDIQSILDRVRDIIERVSAAATWVLGFSLAAGVLVLIAALAATADERRVEIALLRTLGAHRGQLDAAVLGEFAALGARQPGHTQSVRTRNQYRARPWRIPHARLLATGLALLGIAVALSPCAIILASLAATRRISACATDADPAARDVTPLTPAPLAVAGRCSLWCRHVRR
ncbi:MAG: hypothetical protein KIS84_00130 [Dokdonella sp.]|nr:hypothetical protein [Dokdonella sp.]